MPLDGGLTWAADRAASVPLLVPRELSNGRRQHGFPGAVAGAARWRADIAAPRPRGMPDRVARIAELVRRRRFAARRNREPDQQCRCNGPAGCHGSCPFCLRGMLTSQTGFLFDNSAGHMAHRRHGGTCQLTCDSPGEHWSRDRGPSRRQCLTGPSAAPRARRTGQASRQRRGWQGRCRQRRADRDAARPRVRCCAGSPAGRSGHARRDRQKPA